MFAFYIEYSVFFVCYRTPLRNQIKLWSLWIFIGFNEISVIISIMQRRKAWTTESTVHGAHSAPNEIRKSIHFLRLNDILAENTNWKMNKTNRILKCLVLLRICIELSCYYIEWTMATAIELSVKKSIKLRWAHVFV